MGTDATGHVRGRRRQLGRRREISSSEKPVPLFNGKDFAGWEGNIDKYFTIKDGVIVARNEKDNAPKVSNYLLTTKEVPNFRLVFEGKLVERGCIPASLSGVRNTKRGESNSFKGTW